jgi:hypothetical protein
MISVTITLTDSNVHRLDLLMAAALAAEIPARSCPCYEFRSLQILADSGNGGNVYLGNSDVTSSLYADVLAASDLRFYPPTTRGTQRYYASTIYVLGANTYKLHIEAEI